MSVSKDMTIQVGEVNLSPIEHRSRRVITLDMIDRVHGRPEGTAGRNFRHNRNRLREGEDFSEISQPDEIRRLGLARPDGGTPEKVLLLTETGYLMLVKSFRDDLAWEVQRKLVTSYFKVKQEGLSAGQHGGITKAVVNKALDERLEPVERAVLSLAERIKELSAPSGWFKTTKEYVPALSIVDEQNVPQKGRGGLVRRVSNSLDRFCRREGTPVRSEAHTDRRLFHIDAGARWLEAEGTAIIRRHMDRLAGQSIMKFPKPRAVQPPKSEGLA